MACMQPAASQTPQRRKPIRAAGGILLRHTSDGDEVMLVNRKRYNDWTLPKGKAEPGETAAQTALREVREETGCSCVLGEYLGAIGYQVQGRPKLVQYWLMSLVDQFPLTPNDEIAAAIWMKIPDAMARLSYVQERALLSGAVREIA